MTPTLSDPRRYRRPRDLQQFFERVSQGTPPARAPFLKRLFFTGRREQGKDQILIRKAGTQEKMKDPLK